jgi:hypothetical protein
MKTPQARIIVLILCIIAFAPGCGSKSTDGENASDKHSDNDCLIGEWKFIENGVTKSFSFKEDKTGSEAMSPSDIRPYKWTKDDKKISIVYDSDSSGRTWDFTLDCEENVLNVFGLSYKK